jgi:acyl transferase domain-containing protein/NAD(P)H-dependent flavin oxidoreductase YrpB (nitropropane dioxygenase family)/NAD(P)-dependent dehydrogenase (short-subunit alcohol dehydrogenase family)/acyl carrier protein
MRTFDVLAWSPFGAPDHRVAIAASRAGGIGVVNLEWSQDAAAAQSVIEQASSYRVGAFGIKLNVHAPFVEDVLGNLPDQVRTVIFAAHDPAVLAPYIGALQEQRRTVLLEITDATHATVAQQLGVDGLIAKGYEAGGWVGETTTFMLVQQLLAQTALPVYAHGGIGVHTAAACYVAGAAGVVLDDQLALTRESPLADPIRTSIAAQDGSETITLSANARLQFRGYARPISATFARLRAHLAALDDQSISPEEYDARWRDLVADAAQGAEFGEAVVPMGQAIAFAQSLAQRYQTVGGVIKAVRDAVRQHVEMAQRTQPLAEGAPFARSHGIRYPLVQGPMTRVSDQAEFALRVAEEGALPFLALALMRAPDVRALLEETKQLLGDRPWGVGILGFVPPELRREQMEVIRQYRPPVAIIAGGRPDQAQVLENDGIPTYLHVPSPGLLRMFLRDGARRFIFEGRECGGHVGPRSSFVLWNTMIDVLLQDVKDDAAPDVHIVFAGGIHDARSAAMVAAMAAPLSERGMRVGALMGTAYMFTHEAVATKAIVPGFQEAVLGASHTEVIESSPGHAIRCVPTAFVGHFAQEKRRLALLGTSPDEQRQALEDLTVGRLRVASKGITRHPRYGQELDAPRYLAVEEADQRDQGMYMIGQAAAMWDRVVSIADLHHDVSVAGNERLLAAQAPGETQQPAPNRAPCDVAIIGMACLLPKAPDLETYWQHILDKVNAVTEVPAQRWDWRRHYAEERSAPDKIYSKWGGFLDDVPFDPTRYGIPPNALRSIEPIQLLTLEVVRAALADAGYLDRDFAREQTSVILGAGGGVGDLGQQYTTRAMLPEIFEDVPKEMLDQLPAWTEDSFPGILLNVISGRVSNRFDLGGVNYTVDAACASSLASVYQGVRELETGTSDLVITGGVDNVQNPFAFLAFSKTHALSPRGRCRTFDDSADGIAIAEGVAIVVLKRLADAERDGDRIYAVIKGIAGSSDGRDRSLTAPRPEGQARALHRAYAMAGFSPATVGLIEAHGTGTVVGDQAEVETLKQVFVPAGAQRQSCAVGSVKSMIGHTKAAAGVAGLIKVALALHHKVLPATLGVEKPNTKIGFEDSPFYINAEGRPWIDAGRDHPRRAGVSAFGFGGTNFHAVLEEYTGSLQPAQVTTPQWPSELLLWSAPTREALANAVQSMSRQLEQGAQPRLGDLAFSLYGELKQAKGATNLVLGIVASSLDDLRGKLASAHAALTANSAEIVDMQGVFFTERPLAREGKVAFLFPGQGSQYTNMLRDLAVAFPQVREAFERADHALDGRFDRALTSYIFPAPAFTEERERAQGVDLTQTNVAQPALGATSTALLGLLELFNVTPEMVAGHSYGEYVALHAAGAIDQATLAHLSEVRGRSIIEAAQDDLGTMAAVGATADAIAPTIDAIEGVWLANLNSPRQTMISGTRVAIAMAVERLKEQGMSARAIPVACAFHSPIVAPARGRLTEALKQATVKSTRIPVFSNTTASPYPVEPEAIAELLAEHLVRPVRWTEEIEAMYAAGARVFVEVGPRDVATGLVRQILGQQPHHALALDLPGKPGVTQLQKALAQLAVHGVAVKLELLFQNRDVRKLDLQQLVEETKATPLSPTTWLINGGQARPYREPSKPLHPVALPRTTVAASNGSHQGNGHVSTPLNGHGAHPGNGHVSTPSNGLSAPVAHASTPPATTVLSNGNKIGAPSVSVPRPSDHGNETSPLTAVVAQVENSMPVRVAQGGTAQVMEDFQRMMGRFLETQRNVMLSYMAGAPQMVAPVQPSALPKSLPPVAPPARNGDGPEHTQVQPALPPIAVEPVTAQQPEQPLVSERAYIVEPAPSGSGTSNGQLSAEVLTGQLLQIVSERTGYPTDMLDLDQDLEANLGIDSIKRVEIAGQLRQLLPADHATTMDTLSQSRTLRQMLDRIIAVEQTITPNVPEKGSATAQAASADTGASMVSASGAPSGQLSAEVLTGQLLQIVSERTGYPTDMLDLDQDLEANLGIDSIKRVEIAGQLRQLLPAEQNAAMDDLSQSRTLRQMLERVGAAKHTVSKEHGYQNGNGVAPHAAPSAPTAADTRLPIGRFRLRALEQPPASAVGGLAHGRVVVITDDGTGVAPVVAAHLNAQGHPTALLGSAGGDGVDFASPDALEAALRSIQQHSGRVCALVHLQPLGHVAAGGTMQTWHDQFATETRSLFVLAKALYADLQDSATAGGAAVLAASGMGGTFGLGDAPASTFLPAQGGMTGLLKSLAKEWTAVRVKAVDLDPSDGVNRLAESLMSELATADGLSEVGVRAGRRIVVRAVAEAVGNASQIVLDSDAVVLVTGGARGITSDVALELAEQFKPTLVLVGAAPMPTLDEAPDTAGLEGQHALKGALIARWRAQNRVATPAEIEGAYRQLLKEREIRQNLRMLHATGARIQYRSVDVRDERAFAHCIDDIYASFGRLDGVVHGAGIIEDKLLQDKTVGSFDRVTGTKIDSTLTLARHLRPDSLRFLVLFSSVAGCFGNRGQADYAAANEVLNKMAVYLDGRWPGRVVAINWGPWAKLGMVSPELEREFARRGVAVIAPEEGRRRFAEELRYGRKGDAVVVVGGDQL